MASGFGSLWVKRDNGAVDRVSPSGDLEAAIDADIFQQPVCQGIGVTETAVWACATAGTLIRIDPTTNRFTSVDVPKVNEQGRLTSSEGLLWVLTGDGDRLEGVADDGRVTRGIDLGAYCTDVADTASGGTLWVACAHDGLALRVDLRSGQVTGRVRDVPGATAVSVSGDVWVAYEDGVGRVDADSLEIVGTVALDVSSLRAGNGGVWVRGSGEGQLTFVEAESGAITTRLGVPEVHSGGDTVVLQGRRWLSAYDDGVVVRLAR